MIDAQLDPDGSEEELASLASLGSRPAVVRRLLDLPEQSPRTPKQHARDYLDRLLYGWEDRGLASDGKKHIWVGTEEHKGQRRVQISEPGSRGKGKKEEGVGNEAGAKPPPPEKKKPAAKEKKPTPQKLAPEAIASAIKEALASPEKITAAHVEGFTAQLLQMKVDEIKAVNQALNGVKGSGAKAALVQAVLDRAGVKAAPEKATGGSEEARVALEKAREVDPHGPDGVWGPKPNGSVAYGGIVMNDKGEILLREPAGHYDGYHWTFPKGKPDPGDHPADTATREVAEETGHDGAIDGLLPGGHKSGSSTTFFYLMKSAGEDPGKMDAETASTRWVSLDEAARLIGQTTNEKGRERDLGILAELKKHLGGESAPDAQPARTSGFEGDTTFPKGDSLTFAKSLGGSTGAKLFTGPGGSKFVVKTNASPGHLAEEMTADAAYRVLGVPVPDSTEETVDGKKSKVSAWVEGRDLGDFLSDASVPPETREAILKEARKHFVADALLGNWDAAGLHLDNMKVTPDGRVVRIDNGGSLRYRAQGAKKSPGHFGDTVGELQTLRDPSMNASAAEVYGGITPEEVTKQIKDVYGKRKELLAAVPADLRGVLADRLDYLAGQVYGTPKPPQPLFTGVDALGRRWQNGKLVAKQEETPQGKPAAKAEEPKAGKGPPPPPPPPKPPKGKKAKKTPAPALSGGATLKAPPEATGAPPDFSAMPTLKKPPEGTASLEEEDQWFAAVESGITAVLASEGRSVADVLANDPTGTGWTDKTAKALAGKLQGATPFDIYQGLFKLKEKEEHAARTTVTPEEEKALADLYPKGFSPPEGVKNNQPNPALPPESRPRLTLDEAEACKVYSSSDYGPLNDALRTGDVPAGYLADVHKRLQEAFAKAKPLAHPVTVKRGLGLSRAKAPAVLQQYREALASGGPVALHGYQSTTTGDIPGSFDGAITFRIQATQGLDLRPYSTSAHEDEFLLNHGSLMQVKGITEVEPGKWEIEMEQLPGQADIPLRTDEEQKQEMVDGLTAGMDDYFVDIPMVDLSSQE